jgi:hypothetical protein
MARRITAFQNALTGEVFSTEAQARTSENTLDLRKLTLLQARISSGEYWVPEVGDYIYVPGELYIDHGEDDVAGGLSVVVKVKKSTSGGDPNTPFIEVAQTSGSRNWRDWLFEQQADLMKEYGKNFSYPDPDVRS